MKINWFGRMYYGNDKQYRRSLWQILRAFIEWDVIGRSLHIHYHQDQNKEFRIKKNRFNCKESHWI